MKTPWKVTHKSPATDIVIRPYHSSAQSPWRVRGRRLVFAATMLFCLIYGFMYAFLAPFLLVYFAIPLAFLTLLTVWALPDLHNAPTRSLEYLFFAFVVCLVMWPNYLAIALPGIPWITLQRLTSLPLMFLLLICVSTSAQFRTEIVASLGATPLIWRAVTAFVFIQVLSIGVSNQKGESINHFAVYLVSWAGMFFCSAYIFMKPGRIEKWTGLLWGMAIPIGLIGILENREQHVIWAGHIPRFLQIEDPNIAMVMHGIKRAYTDIYRVQSTFGTSLGLAEYLALTIPFVIHYAVGPFPQRTRIAAAVSIPFILYIILISGSRLGVLGFGISGLLYLFAWALLRWRREPGSLLASTILIAYPAIFGIAIGASFFIGRLRKAVWGTGASQGSTDARVVQMHMGIPLILKHPWGYGLAEGAVVLDFHNPGGILTIDSYYLDIALDYGIIGFIIYYGMISIPLYYAGKEIWRNNMKERESTFLVPISIAIIVFLVVKSIFSQADNHPLVFMMLGMVCAICYRINQRDKRAIV